MVASPGARAVGIRWGLSLDMVGEDTKKTGGTFLIEKMPDPSAIWTRGEDKHTEWGGSALTKEQMTPHYFNDLVLGRALEMAATNGWVVKSFPSSVYETANAWIGLYCQSRLSNFACSSALSRCTVST